MSSSENMTESEKAEEPRAPGPNLALIYCLLGLALLVAIVVAAFIVLPFYQHR